MTLRLPKVLAEQLALVARVDRVDQAEVVHRALFDYIHTRISDPMFRADARNHVVYLKLLIGDTDA
jgi:hypothetical protein